tara:strand:+ start:1095 stop:2456 length:1362 start_codon:yes stop_codon:yes gene_type:complete
MAKKYEKIHPDIKYGLTQRSRLTALDSALQISDQKYTVKLKGAQSLTLDVKKIEVDKLKYRIKNNRARSAQNMWIEKNEDKITKYIEEYSLQDYQPRVNYSERTNWLREQDPEHEIIQRIQHEILNNFNINKDRIFKEFSEDGVEQEEPLIVNKAGFVLSGNRRLSCFRQLSYYEINEDLKYAEIVYWKNSTPEQENNVEQRRDGGKPVDEPYDWFSTGEWIEDQRKGAEENGYEVDYDEICRETRRDKDELDTIVNRYRNALTFIAHQRKAGLTVRMEKILSMQQALDEYSKVMGHDKVKKLPLKRKVVFRNMIAPYMIQGKDYGSAYLMIKSAAKDASKFIDAFISLSPNIKNEDELDEFVKNPDNWEIATDTLGRARRRVENDKTKKKKRDAGFNALERMANEDIKTVIEYLKNPNKNKALLKNKKFPELINSLQTDFKEVISLIRKFKK